CGLVDEQRGNEVCLLQYLLPEEGLDDSSPEPSHSSLRKHRFSPLVMADTSDSADSSSPISAQWRMETVTSERIFLTSTLERSSMISLARRSPVPSLASALSRSLRRIASAQVCRMARVSSAARLLRSLTKWRSSPSRYSLA